MNQRKITILQPEQQRHSLKSWISCLLQFIFRRLLLAERSNSVAKHMTNNMMLGINQVRWPVSRYPLVLARKKETIEKNL